MKRQQGLYRRHGSIFCFRYQDKDKIWHEHSTGETERDKALEKKAEFLEQVKNDALPGEKGNWTVEQACTRWVREHVLRSAKGRSNERSALRILLRSTTLARKKLKKVTFDDLKTYRAVRHADGKGVGARPINIELTILIRVLKESNLWQGAMAENYKPLPEPREYDGVRLSIDQLQFLEGTARERDEWYVAFNAFMLAANSGLRKGEIRKLTLGAVDLENRRVSIKRETTKSNSSARLVELNVAAVAAVTRLLARAEALGATEPSHFLLPGDASKHTRGSDPVRGSGFDPRIPQVSWDRAWRSIRKRSCDRIKESAAKQRRGLTPRERETVALFERVRFHDLWHSFVSLLGENGVPLQVIRSAVGHMTDAMTTYYTHISGNAQRQAVELLDKIFPNRVSFVDSHVDEGESLAPGLSKQLN